MKIRKETHKIVYADDLMPPFKYLCEDAWLAWKVYADIESKISCREDKVRKLVKEILELLPSMSQARIRYEESVQKARLRNSLTKDVRILKTKKILEIGKECYESRQAEYEQMHPPVKHFPKIDEAHQ